MGVLLGGSIALLEKILVKRKFSVWEILFVTVILYAGLRYCLRKYFVRGHNLIYEVDLFCDGNEYHMKALLDTGNNLIEPISKKAVCLVGKEYFEKQWVKEGERKSFQPQKFRVIPFQAVGTPKGILNGYEMDRLIIYTDERKVEIEKPVIGISESNVGTTDTYQMILQPKLLREGVK